MKLKAALSLGIFFLYAVFAHAQTLYTRAFGSSENQPVIFLHGGPGYNSANFEATTAQKLADNGFYVIVYDRRGEGRSVDKNAKFTFEETFKDLNTIYEQYKLKKAMLIGHSFGGVVATLFTEKYPGKVNSVVLVGAPLSLQQSFRHIIRRTKEIYTAKKDSLNLNYIRMLESMDTSSLQYSSYCLMHAMHNGFYSPKQPTDEAKQLYALFRTDTLLMKYAAQMTNQAPMGFWANEKYTTLDLTSSLQKLHSKKIPVYGLYGKDDGLYAEEQITALRGLLGEENLKYIDNCSHNVFIDQQTVFIEALKSWRK